MDKKKCLPTVPATSADGDRDSLSSGIPGPTLLQDTALMEKLAHFNRERIPERVVHAKGAGAYGVFEVTHDVTRFTCADFLSEIGKKTDVLVRFSMMSGEKGSADTLRDPRGFAVKFYTCEGNYDVVGQNSPVFFIRDAMQFPDLVHAQKRNPTTNLRDANMQWDFYSLTPESLHQVLVLFSDRGIPLTYRHMHGYGNNTFMWYNAHGEYYWVKLHWITCQGIRTLTPQEAVALAGTEPGHASRDLYRALSRCDYPVWTLMVQVMTPHQAHSYRFDPFDATKVWYHKDFPLMPVGRLILNRYPQNAFAEVEQAAFAPGHFVPGVGPSPDKLLQGRLFAYPDAQRYRLGPNYHLIPVNRPYAQDHTYQRDGAMMVDDNGGGRPNYFPNTLGGSVPKSRVVMPPVDIAGMSARHPYPVTARDFEQPGELYRHVMSLGEREQLLCNIAQSLTGAMKRLQYRQTALFSQCDEDLGRRLAGLLKLDWERVVGLSYMSQEERVEATS